MVFILFLAVLILIPPAAAANWYNPSWPDRQNITINKAYVTGTGVTLTNFPVLISISDTYLTSGQVQSNGNDILFTASDGTTKLSHEIENFTQSTGTLVAWVNVPSLPNSTNTTIYMYYGNPAASNQQNAAGVWDSNYNAVWHLSQNPAGSAPQIRDSTSNANSATSGGGMTASQQVQAKINGGLNFNGFNNFLATNYVQTAVTNYTIETWLKTSNTSQVQATIVQDRGTNSSTGGTGQSITLSVGGTYPGSAGTAGDVAYGLDSNAIYIGDYSTKVVNDNTWHMVAGTWSAPAGTAISPTQFIIYIDGVAVTETAATTGAATSPVTGLFGTQIAQHQPWATFFNGTLDELRISKILRSANWISTEYNNQNSPGTFSTVYPPEYSTISSGFTGSPTSGLAPLAVQFTVTNMNLIANNATYVNWSFGDGSVANLTSPAAFNVSHTYSSGGSYTVSESVSNTAAINITTLSNYITVSSWTNANGCWTATIGNQNLVMWNATGSSTWTAPAGIKPNVWYLVVAGGGGGGRYGGGGGAGGFLNGTLTVSSGSTNTVTVGTSGAGATTAAVGGHGGNSVFSTITATGGGGGGSSSGTVTIRSGAAGGSGGGGVRNGGTGGAGTAPQGNNGGAGSTSGFNYYGGGGGGGTVAGAAAATTTCGKGGNGNVSSLTGTSVTYAGGGGGGGFTGGTPGAGGTGGGGGGGVGATAGTAGTINTGGGGGGGGSTGNGGNGGSGIVIISYSITTSPTFVSAATNAAGTAINITFSKAMADPAGDQTQFTYSINGGSPQSFSAAALDSNTSVIDLTTSGTIPYGATITVNYTAGTVKSADGGVLATFSNKPVTNNVVSFVAITLNKSSIPLTLVAGSTASDSSLGITTTANAPFTITVADNTLRGSNLGYMGSYTGTNYDSGGPNLASPLRLAGTTNSTTTAQTITPPILSGGSPLYTGTAAVTNQLLSPNTFSQQVAYSDPSLPSGSTYRIDLSFIIQPS